MKPERALIIIKSLLDRCPMTPAEVYAANAALQSLVEATKPPVTPESQ